jgi:hypothetical protein
MYHWSCEEGGELVLVGNKVAAVGSRSRSKNSFLFFLSVSGVAVVDCF